MKLRLAIAAALAAGLALSVSGAQAATPVMDGKRVKTLTMKNAPGTKQHQEAFLSYDATTCRDKVLCPKLTFLYNPARGAKGGLMFTTTWTNPASDIDISVVQYDRRGNGTVVGSCGGFGNTTEKVYLSSRELKKGTKYALVVHMFRAVEEKSIISKVQMGVRSTVKTTVPDDADFAINCTL